MNVIPFHWEWLCTAHTLSAMLSVSPQLPLTSVMRPVRQHTHTHSMWTSPGTVCWLEGVVCVYLLLVLSLFLQMHPADSARVSPVLGVWTPPASYSTHTHTLYLVLDDSRCSLLYAKVFMLTHKVNTSHHCAAYTDTSLKQRLMKHRLFTCSVSIAMWGKRVWSAVLVSTWRVSSFCLTSFYRHVHTAVLERAPSWVLMFTGIHRRDQECKVFRSVCVCVDTWAVVAWVSLSWLSRSAAARDSAATRFFSWSSYTHTR